MKGFSQIDAEWVSGIPKMADTPFSFTEHSFNTLIPACQRITEQIIKRAGGEVGETAYMIPRQAPKAPEKLEQWTNQAEYFSAPIPPQEMIAWDSAWDVRACGFDMEPGVRPEQYGRKSVLVIHPVNKETAAVLTATLDVPQKDKVTMVMDIASDERGDFLLKVFVADAVVTEEVIDTKGKWKTISVDLSAYAGKSVEVRLENHPTGWSWEAAYIDEIRVE